MGTRCIYTIKLKLEFQILKTRIRNFVKSGEFRLSRNTTIGDSLIAYVSSFFSDKYRAILSGTEFLVNFFQK